jgi:hypothetical protein
MKVEAQFVPTRSASRARRSQSAISRTPLSRSRNDRESRSIIYRTILSSSYEDNF